MKDNMARHDRRNARIAAGLLAERLELEQNEAATEAIKDTLRDVADESYAAGVQAAIDAAKRAFRD